MFRVLAFAFLISLIVSEEIDDSTSIILWSDATNFPDAQINEPNIKDLRCFIQGELFGLCKSTLGANFESFHIDVIATYFFDNEIDENAVPSMKQSLGPQNHFIEMKGVEYSESNHFRHLLSDLIHEKQSKIYPEHFDDFKMQFTETTKMVFFNPETFDASLSLSKEVAVWMDTNHNEKRVLNVMVPYKNGISLSDSELSQLKFLMGNAVRSLLATSNTTANASNCWGGPCIKYSCNNSKRHRNMDFGNSCISSYMAFGFGLFIFLLIPYICIGCYSMNTVETPLRVPTRILPVRKEY